MEAAEQNFLRIQLAVIAGVDKRLEKAKADA